jgi:2-C-methyl-D-erythritol 2,4-cyclodiphosphate synthase
MCPFRVGNGFDVHVLVEGRKLIICGVQIPYEKGLLGHSDADVAIHALMDALLGATALGDIGKLFPDTDEKFKDANSMVLLEKVMEKVKEKGWFVGNVDITIMAEAPKLFPYREDMKNNVSKALGIGLDEVNIKATTTEKLGFIGRKEGIAAQSTVLLYKN